MTTILALLQSIKAVRHPIRAAQALRSVWRTRTGWDAAWARVPEPRVLGPVEVSDATRGEVIAALAARRVAVEPTSIDIDGFRRFVARARYGRFPFYYAGGREPGFNEKALEHYLAATLLDLQPDDVYVDVANYDSPVPRIYREMFGCSTYAQDLLFPPGVRGHRIGGSAAAMPVTDGFASAMGLHNSFEHFEGGHDIGFVREAVRVLRPGGRVCIVPLFLFTRYAIQTNPVELPPAGIVFDDGAVLYGARGWRNRHGRWYDADHLASRIFANAPPLAARVLSLTNAQEVHPECYAQFALMLERPF